MKYCRECGFENKEEALFCKNCGAKFDETVQESSTEPVAVKEEVTKPVINPSQIVIVNKNNDSIISKLFFKTDKYSGELRFAKTKSISIAVFVLMFLLCMVVNGVTPFIPIVIASIIFGLMFAVPTYVIGYVVGMLVDRISN